MSMPYSLHASITSASATDPPGCAIYCTPYLLAWSIESLNGKNASDDRLTPAKVDRKELFSSSESV